MRHWRSAQGIGAAAFRQVYVDEVAMTAREPRERAERLDYAGAARPAGADAASQRNHGHAPLVQSLHSDVPVAAGSISGVPHIAVFHIADIGAGGQPVLRQADAAPAQIRPNLLVLGAVKPQFRQQLVERSALLAGRAGAPRQQNVEYVLDHGTHLVALPARSGEAGQFGFAGVGQQAGVRFDQRRNQERIVGGRHERGVSLEQPGFGAAFVDGEIVYHRLHGERHGPFELLLGFPHQRAQPFLCLRPNLGVEHESHPAAGHSAQHPEAIEIPAELRADSVDQRFRVEVAGPRDDGLNGSEKVAFGGRPQRRNVAGFQASQNLVEDGDRLLASLPFRFPAQQVFLGDHFEDRPHVLRHAAVHQDQAVFELLSGARWHFFVGEDVMARQQTTAADAEFRVGLRREYSLDHFHPRPHAAGILPAAARTAQPFSQNRPSRHQAALILFERSRQRAHLTGGAHRDRDDGSQQIGGNRQAGAFGDSAHVGDDLQAVARHSGQRGQNVGEGLARPFQSWRNDAGGDDTGFE